MSRFAIVVDGTASLTPAQQHEQDIRILPLHVEFGERSYTQGVDLSVEDFYRMLKEPNATPGTSQPSMGETRDLYEAAIRDGAREILVLTIAPELSGTHSVATATAQQVDGARIEVVDTRSVAGGISLIATACARLRRDGRSFDEAVAQARALAGKIQILAAVDTLEHLRRSGRVSGGGALFGSLLSIKPIIEVRDGRVEPVERVRTRERALARLKDLIASRIPADARIHVCLLHTNDPDRAYLLGEWALARFHCVEHWIAEAGPVIGARGGAGLVGMCWYREGAI